MRFLLVLCQILLALQFTSGRHRQLTRNSNEAEAEVAEAEVEVAEANDYLQNEESTSPPPQSQGKTNQFVDFVLSSVGSMIRVAQLQPFRIPDATKMFSKNFFGIRWSGEATLHNGSIFKGLETIHRIGNATLVTTLNETHSSKALTFEVELENIGVATQYKLELMEVGPNGDFTARAEHLKVLVEFLITSAIHNGQDVTIELEKLKIVDLSPLTFNMGDSWPFEYFAKIITSIMSKLFQKVIVRNLEKIVKELLTRMVNEATESSSSKSLIAKSLKFL